VVELLQRLEPFEGLNCPTLLAIFELLAIAIMNHPEHTNASLKQQQLH
jgi:hypothetical protein